MQVILEKYHIQENLTIEFKSDLKYVLRNQDNKIIISEGFVNLEYREGGKHGFASLDGSKEITTVQETKQ